MNFMKGAKVQIQAKRPGVRGRPEDGDKVTSIRAVNPGVDNSPGSSQQAPASSPVGSRQYFACHQLLCCCTVSGQMCRSRILTRSISGEINSDNLDPSVRIPRIVFILPPADRFICLFSIRDSH